MSQLAHELRTVVAPSPLAAGRLRLFELGEVELLCDWLQRFSIDAGLPPAPIVRETVEQRMADGRAFLWDDDGPVSMALRSRDTRKAGSINAVYTPPELRGRGYASACVAALSQQILDDGKSVCCLFTDAANPTSNGIYRSIGYRPVSEFVDIVLEAE